MKKHEPIIVYKQMVIIPHETGVDLVNPVTGKWRTTKSVHAAKWHVGVSERMAKHFLFLQMFANNQKSYANLATPCKSDTVTKSVDFAHP